MIDAEAQLAMIYEILKDHHTALRDLAADVDGLKATMTGADQERFDAGKKATLDSSAQKIALDSQRFDAIIAKFRGK